MARRVAELDYRVTGDGGATSKVRTLATALDQQKRSAQAAMPALNAASRGSGLLGTVSQASAGQVMMLTGALGPLGAGLGMVATRAPLAARGLLSVAVAQERVGLLSRASNAALLGGAAVMATGAVAAAAYAGNILRGADAYASLNSRLKIFSDGAVAAAQNEQQLYERAADARTGVENLSTLFVRITPAIDDMGRAQSDALQVTENTSKALAIQGATMAENAAATIQFSQAIASGVLRGDELRSMLESSPLLLRYISQNLELNGKIGVAFGQLRKLGEEGALTADRLINALLRASPQIEADFINAPKTAQQGWTVLKDTITRTVGQLSQRAGLQEGVFGFLSDLSTKLNDFRQKALLDPNALDPAIKAGQLLGDTLAAAGTLAGGVVENFDLIVSAAQALIALKAGEMLAIGFGAAAAKAREAYGAIQSFRANGPFLAGAALDQTGAAAAINARQAAIAAEARALDLKTQAELRARTATAARSAADAASVEVTRLKSAAEVNAAAVSVAEAQASALNTAAERAEAGAKSATTAATTAQTAASTRLAIAQQAEAAVTAQVTNAQALKAATMRGLSSLYALIGGNIGLVTLVLGGMIYAVWQSEQAWQKKIESLRDAAVVSDDLINISNALTSSTWAEIPALLASADALREKAKAAREAAEAIRQEAQADVDRAAASAGRQMQGGGLSNIGQGLAAGVSGRRAAQAAAVVAAADRDRFAANEATRQANLRALTVEGRARSDENRTGRDAAGREISAERRGENTARLAEINRIGLANVEALDRSVKAQRDAIAAATGDEKRRLQQGLTLYNRSWEAGAEASTVGQANPNAVRPPAGGGGGGGKKGRSSAASAEDRAAASLLERVSDAALLQQLMGRAPETSSRFTVDGGKLSDGGQTFVARSEDEARAAAAYLEQIEAITSAKQSLIDETGMTREALAAQAAQTLETALATSQATQADQRWQEKLAETRGESTAVAQAEREVAEARKQGATITDAAVASYIALVRAQEAARRAQEALNAVRPIVDDVARTKLEDMGRTPERWRTDVGGMGFDVDAALAQWAAAREDIAAEVERRIRAEQAKAVADGLKSQEQADRDTGERIAAARVALNTQNAEQVAEIWRRQREDDEQAWRDRFQDRLDQEQQLADSITGSLEDLAMGADPSDVGKRFAEDLMQAIWQELVTNPLNLMIRNLLREITGGESGGLWGAIGKVLGGASPWGGGFGGQGPAADLNGLYRDGGLPGYDRGGLPGVRRLPPGLIRGPGGPRDDRILARVSSREFISNAAATQRHLPLLAALNAGRSLAEALNTVPAFAGGGMPGGMADMLAREAANGDYGYVYGTAMDHDRDRSRAETVRDAPATDLTVNVINQTGQSVQATRTRTPEGWDVILRPAVQSEVKRMGADGSLGRAAQSAPPMKRR